MVKIQDFTLISIFVIFSQKWQFRLKIENFEILPEFSLKLREQNSENGHVTWLMWHILESRKRGAGVRDINIKRCSELWKKKFKFIFSIYFAFSLVSAIWFFSMILMFLMFRVTFPFVDLFSEHFNIREIVDFK